MAEIAENQRWMLVGLSDCEEIAGIITARSPACESDGCKHVPRITSLKAALAVSPLPCRAGRRCYGYMQPVFKDELTPEQFALLSKDF
ncbi:MAG: hypothetical protein BGP10_12440 [Rhodanobacter sp. 68-29]|nr:MAG: hypothetical protein ABT19_00360 [Rhodanobacter sp. SCN 68-63]OJY60699.1 MAG: hypothetical protein BGP10_12440 [Rhodanobacter sp. 68-29]